MKTSKLRCIVPRSAVWSGGWACVCGLVWLSSFSCVSGMSSLEAYPRFVWLSLCKLPVVRSFTATISSLSLSNFQYLGDLSFEFQLVSVG